MSFSKPSAETPARQNLVSGFHYIRCADLVGDVRVEIRSDFRCPDADDQGIPCRLIVSFEGMACLPLSLCRVDSDASLAHEFGGGLPSRYLYATSLSLLPFVMPTLKPSVFRSCCSVDWRYSCAPRALFEFQFHGPLCVDGSERPSAPRS